MADNERIAELVSELITAQNARSLIDRLWDSLPPEECKKLALDMVKKASASARASDFEYRFGQAVDRELEQYAREAVQRFAVELQLDDKLKEITYPKVRDMVQDRARGLVSSLVEDIVRELRLKSTKSW